jgi:hypothetical protein
MTSTHGTHSWIIAISTNNGSGGYEAIDPLPPRPASAKSSNAHGCDANRSRIDQPWVIGGVIWSGVMARSSIPSALSLSDLYRAKACCKCKPPEISGGMIVNVDIVVRPSISKVLPAACNTRETSSSRGRPTNHTTPTPNNGARSASQPPDSSPICPTRANHGPSPDTTFGAFPIRLPQLTFE